MAAVLYTAGAVSASDPAISCPLCGGDPPRPQDAVWLVSTRHLHHPGVSGSDRLGGPEYWRFEPGGGWHRANRKAFYATDDPSVLTTVYVHGNRVDRHRATHRGWVVYRLLAEGAPEDLSLRHVIWSWPSDRVPGPLRDVRSKAHRALAESYLLGHWLAAVNPRVRISMVGYSFGPRVITGAIHLAAGGTVAGQVLPVATPADNPRVRVVALAGALDNDWLLPGHLYGKAVSIVDRMLVTYNPQDPILRGYSLLIRGKRPTALGLGGLPRQDVGRDAASRIDQVNVAAIIGNKHDWNRYTHSSRLIQIVRRYALWESIDPIL